MSNIESATSAKPLRLWPGIVGALLLAAGVLTIGLVKLVPAIPQDVWIGGLGAAVLGAVIIALWWLLLSRAPWLERLGALVAMVVAVAVSRPLLDESIAGGAMGGLGYMLTFPLLAAGLVVWAIASRHSRAGIRRATLLPAMLLAAGLILLLRTDGLSGRGFDLKWRWTPTAEDRLLAEDKEEPLPLPTAMPSPIALAAPKESASEPAVTSVPNSPVPNEAVKPAAWPGFRGPLRDGIVRGVRIETDWSKSPPTKLWSRPIGPGWSSFAVDGDIFYTQEQRGEEEIVAAYRVSTGQPIWRHRDPVRFYESNAGAGPRGTPTLSGGRVYSFGGTGVLNALDAKSGAVLWSRNVSSDSTTEVPAWGFSSSPLVVDDLVIIAAEGKLAAYEKASGTPRWFGPAAGFGYSSPQLATIGGVRQVLLQSRGVKSFDPITGKLLWQHEMDGGAIVQPGITADGDVLVNNMSAMGGPLTRLTIAHPSDDEWSVTERWTSNGLKPYYNDYVIHKGYAYGFDGSILSSIDLVDGARKWKGGRYGAGQLVLLFDQDILLVLGDEGDLALVSATPDGFKEISRFKAIEGKTWNHPVLVGDTLLVRNAEEMAAFSLTVAPR
jgi:outer membrane protein assembly factor BamB